MTTEIASAKDGAATVVIKYIGGRGQPGQDGSDGTGFNDVRFNVVNSPLLSLFKANKIAKTVAPNNQDSDVAVIRSSIKKYIDNYGVLQQAAVNELAIERDGALIEEAATNLCLYSEQYDNAAWTKSGVTVTANTETAPDLTTNADTLSFGAGSSIDQGVSVAGASERITHSLFVKNGGINTITIRWISLGGTTQDYFNEFSFLTESFTLIDPNCDVEAVKLSNGWWRLCVSAQNNNTGNTTFRPRLFSATAGDLYAFGTQVELSGTCTSYIQTVASTAGRSADNVEVQTYNNAVFNGEWTFFANVKIGTEPVNHAIWGVEPVPAANNPRLIISTDRSVRLVDSTGATLIIAPTSSVPETEVVSLCVRAAANGAIDCYINGLSQGAAQAATINNISNGNLKIGETGLAAEQERLNISDFSWYNEFLTEQEIKLLSNP